MSAVWNEIRDFFRPHPNCVTADLLWWTFVPGVVALMILVALGRGVLTSTQVHSKDDGGQDIAVVQTKVGPGLTVLIFLTLLFATWLVFKLMLYGCSRQSRLIQIAGYLLAPIIIAMFVAIVIRLFGYSKVLAQISFEKEEVQ